MKYRLFFLLLFTTALFSAQKSGGEASFALLQPLDKTILKESFATVTADIKGQNFDKLEIYVNDILAAELPAEKGKSVYCKTVALELGENTVYVEAYLNDAKVAEQFRKVFYLSEVFAGFDEAPDEYERVPFHTSGSEERCSACHSFSPLVNGEPVLELKKNENNVTTDRIDIESLNVPESPEEVTCYQCHKPLLSRKNSHAPSINWLCAVCHVGSRGEYDARDSALSSFDAPDPIIYRCFSCHVTKEEDWGHNRSEHGPTRTGRCIKCHNPHSSDHEFFLRKSIWNLCTTCHAEKATGRHVVAVFGSFGKKRNFHPTKGAKDPVRPGRELVCSGCHNPHGSKGPFLLRTNSPVVYSVCKRCHPK